MTVVRNSTSLSPVNTEEALQHWVQENARLLEILLDAYCVVDPANRVVHFNEAFTELCGEPYRKILKTGNFCELVKTELCPGRCPAKQVMTAERSLRLDELRGATKALSSLHMILSAVPISVAEHGTIGALITIRNVSAESELQKKYDERKKDSITDGLTRLYNKVYTESVLVRLLKTASRDRNPISIVMCDIDHFKSVNDSYGHQAGDHVLATVAQMLKGESRDTDIVGRFGGEEFIAVLYKSDAVGAKIFAERFRKRVEKSQISFDGKDIPVTVSLGSATYQSDWTPGVNMEQVARDIINQADSALYLAKANGRNQTWQFALEKKASKK